MKYLLLIAVLLSSFANAGDYSYYVKVGTGYKIQEPDERVIVFMGQEYISQANYGSKVTARFEAGIEKGALTFGVAHHSQWLDGAPFNKDVEYFKTELFIDYKWEW